ncbi:MAG: ATP synthase F1 subunit delta [Balneolaceae bacterium]|jgi:F-type H+-transporting ATPase subunit delta|nr:MAG: ATP synthase F1 subunit delta [Balneolaceae bacterium]
MLSSKASRRYATALLKIAVENKSVDTVIADIGVMKATFDGSKELILILGNPIVRKEKKLSVLTELFRSRVGKTTWKLIELMAEKDRLALLPGMASDYIRQHNLYAGILEVQITSAFDLDDDQRKNLLAMLAKTTGKKIQAAFMTNPDLRGGVVVRIEDTVIDGSVKHKLEQLQQTMYRTAV